jgi:hypothetical protein
MQQQQQARLIGDGQVLLAAKAVQQGHQKYIRRRRMRKWRS